MTSLKDLKPVRINFNLRQVKETDEVTGVNCVMRWNNQKLVLTSVERIKPKYWNDREQKAKTKMIGYAEFNTRIKTIQSNIEKVFRAFITDNNQYPTIEECRTISKTAINKQAGEIVTYSKNIIIHIDQYIADCETGVITVKGSPLSSNSVKRYYALKNNLNDYAKTKKIKDLTFDRITKLFLDGFKRFLIIDKCYTPGTISTRLAGLTTIMNKATDLDVNVNLDYRKAGLNEDVPQTFEIYLNLNELDILQSLDLSNNPRLDRVRDLLILGCWTGTRSCDQHLINHKSIHLDAGNKNIRITPSKTKKEVIIPVFATTQRILDKYTNPDLSIELPKLTNQCFNLFLKELGKLAGLNEPITYERVKAGKKETITTPKYMLLKTHSMRRSFSTNLYEMGEDIKAIMDATGHTRTDIFFNYIRRSNTDSANKLRNTVETVLRQRMKAVG